MQINKDLVAASSTPIVLAILAEGDSYGYAILQRVRELSGGRMEWSDGMLYPVLHRLERLGHIEARWEVAESGRRRRYYASARRRATRPIGFDLLLVVVLGLLLFPVSARDPHAPPGWGDVVQVVLVGAHSSLTR